MSTTNNFYCLAFGIGTKNSKGAWLEASFPVPAFRPDQLMVKKVGEVLGYTGGNQDVEMGKEQIENLISALSEMGSEYAEQTHILRLMTDSVKPTLTCFIASDEKPTSTPETYLKLHLLSLRYVKPNEQNLDDLFALLPNLAWTNQGAIDIEELRDAQIKARVSGDLLEVSSVDKFPRMANYVMPSGVRIAHCARVRLGAYLGAGTTVMPEGLVNFNAGTLGESMVEGRISQGVIVGEGSDLGGSSSTAGTLSGGGSIVLSIGKDCLISANAGTGIPLGDRCTIEAGLYITPGTLVQVLDEERNPVKVVKARELAGQSDMLFIRNSQTGTVECRTNKKAIQLNQSLHAHN